MGVAPRRWEPFTGRLALPGVLLAAGERLQDAARRAVIGKLGVDGRAIAGIGQLAVFDEPSRDPRGPTMSIAMWAVLEPDAGSLGFDDVRWHPVDEPADLAFDHDRILADGLRIAGERLLWHDPEFTRALLGAEFPASRAVDATEQLTGRRPDPGNLNRLLRTFPGLERTDERVRVQARGRPSVVWRWAADGAGASG